LGYNEHFVPKTPSGNYSSKTKVHDEMHEWLLEPENIKSLIARIHQEDIERIIEQQQKPFNYRINILLQEQEEPVYNGTYLVGVPDCVVTYDFEDIVYDAKLVIELKPYIESVGGVIAQTKLYANAISINHYGIKEYKSRRPKMAVITYDENVGNYELIHREGIHIIIISKYSPRIKSSIPEYMPNRTTFNNLDAFWRRKKDVIEVPREQYEKLAVAVERMERLVGIE
jgi:hypothetical protein